jgi:hypothetical protein
MPAKKTGSETGTTKAKKTSTKKTTKKVETPVEVKKKVFTWEWKKMSFSINFKPDGKNLVIVESPAKAKTIQGYLGSDYQVIASMGHVVDLPVKSVGINTKTFEVDYIVTPEKIDQVKKIANLAQQSKKIWLATDEDREGEAISRHLARTLNLDIANTPRIHVPSIWIWSMLNNQDVLLIVWYDMAFHQYYGIKSKDDSVHDVYSRSLLNYLLNVKKKSEHLSQVNFGNYELIYKQ